jgi:hypothetical protein
MVTTISQAVGTSVTQSQVRHRDEDGRGHHQGHRRPELVRDSEERQEELIRPGIEHPW